MIQIPKRELTKTILDLNVCYFSQFPFMGGISIINGTLRTKRNDDETEDQPREEDDETRNEPENNNEETTKPEKKYFTSAPTTKCRVQLNDVIDLVGPNNNDIKLLRISHLQSRYWFFELR